MTELIPQIAPRPDGTILHFLKELPGVVWVFVMLIFFTIIYLNFRDDFIPRIIDALIGAFLGLVVSQRQRQPTVNAQKIETGDVITGDAEEKPKQGE
jgi:hypothetical protein